MGKRLPNKTGSITWHKKWKLWYGRVSCKGKRFGAYNKVHSDLVEGLKELGALHESAHDPCKTKSKKPGKLTVGTYLNEWLSLGVDSKGRAWKPKTMESYESIVRWHLIPRLGDTKLKDLSELHINEAWKDMRAAVDEKGMRKHSESVIEHCHLRLATALSAAVRRRYIDGNPIAFVAKPIAEPKEMRPLSNVVPENGKSEIDQILDAAWGTPYYAIIHTALYTSKRRNELLALRVGDIDLTKGVMYVRYSIHRSKGKTTFQTPKGIKAGSIPKAEMVELPEESVRILSQYLDYQRTAGKDCGHNVTPDSPLFVSLGKKCVEREPNTTNRFSCDCGVLPNSITHAFKRITRGLGIEDTHFHLTRHTHASIAHEKGIGDKDLQARLSHKTLKQTMGTYVHTEESLTGAWKDFTLAPVSNN